MKYKIGIFVFALIVFSAIGSIKAQASTYLDIINNPNYGNVVYVQSYWNNDPNQGTVYYLCGTGSGQFIADINSGINNIVIHKSRWTNFDYYRYNVDPLLNQNTDAVGFSTNSSVGFLAVNLRGDFVDYTNNDLVFDSLEDYENYLNPPADPTWWERVGDYLTSWIGDYTVFDLVSDLWDDWFGFHLDGDDVDYGNPVILTEPPSPTPYPTQIPYQTLIVPDGNGGQQIIYKYPDPSGNPITATAPPPEPTYTIRITDSPVIELSGVPIPPDEGMQDVIDAIDDNLEEYQPGFEAIGNSMSVLPVKWFFFFGIPAAIIIIAGVIKSLLG